MADGKIGNAVSQKLLNEGLMWVSGMGLAAGLFTFFGPKLRKLISGRDPKPKIVGHFQEPFFKARLVKIRPGLSGVQQIAALKAVQEPTQNGPYRGYVEAFFREWSDPEMVWMRAAKPMAQEVNEAFASFMETKSKADGDQLGAKIKAFLSAGYPISDELATALGIAVRSETARATQPASFVDPVAQSSKSKSAEHAPVPLTNSTIPAFSSSISTTIDQVEHVALDIQNALVPNKNSAGAQTRIGTSPTSTAAVASAPPNSPTGGALFLLAIPALFLLS